jgi:hypothetical protein
VHVIITAQIRKVSNLGGANVFPEVNYGFYDFVGIRWNKNRAEEAYIEREQHHAEPMDDSFLAMRAAGAFSFYLSFYSARPSAGCSCSAHGLE